MKSNEKLWDICLEIYNKMYKEAKPSADFDKLMKLGITKKPNWFMKYFLPTEKQETILEKICKKYKLCEYEKRKIRTTVYLGSAPNSSEETWKKARKKK